MTLSLNFRQAAFEAESGVFPICLITIDHADLPAPIRLSTDPTQRISEPVADVVYGTVSRGNSFYFFPCELKLPDDTDDGPGQMSLQFSNVNRDYIAIIRSITGRPTVNIEMVLSNALNTVEAQWPEFLITDVNWDAGLISFSMSMETLEREGYPSGSYTPAAFPGLFRSL